MHLDGRREPQRFLSDGRGEVWKRGHRGVMAPVKVGTGRRVWEEVRRGQEEGGWKPSFWCGQQGEDQVIMADTVPSQDQRGVGDTGQRDTLRA
jgi:hypothetical protein